MEPSPAKLTANSIFLSVKCIVLKVPIRSHPSLRLMLQFASFLAVQVLTLDFRIVAFSLLAP